MFGISISDSIITVEYTINLLNLSELNPFCGICEGIRSLLLPGLHLCCGEIIPFRLKSVQDVSNCDFDVFSKKN